MGNTVTTLSGLTQYDKYYVAANGTVDTTGFTTTNGDKAVAGRALTSSILQIAPNSTGSG